MSKVCVIGTGAVGSIITLSASLGGCNVIPFSRREEIREIVRPFPMRFKVFESGTLPSTCDYVIISVKSYDTKSVADLISLGFIKGPVLVVAQNGIGGLETIKKIVEDNVIVASAVVNLGVIKRGPLVELKGEGPIYLGCIGYDCTWALEPLAKCLKMGGLNIILSSNISTIRKEKVIVNAIINTLTTILHVKNGYLLADNSLDDLIRILSFEASISLGVNPDNVITKVKEIAKLTSDNLSSMLQDLESCNPLELESIVKPIARTSPVYLVFYKLLRALRKKACESNK